MSDCRKVRRLLAVQSMNWSAGEQIQVKDHLNTCLDCSALARVYTEQDQLIHSLPRAGLTPVQRGQFLLKIQQERKRHKMFSKPLAILGTIAATLVLAAMGLGVQTLLENGQPAPAAPVTQPSAVQATQPPTTQVTQSPTAVATPQKTSTATLNLVWPVEGYITQPYSPEHPAIDIAAEEGTPIVAAAAGVVVAAGWDDAGAGNFIVINHGDMTFTRYTHLLDYQVEIGDEVSQGQKIGRVGSTGESTGPHLHFELMLKIDPTPLLNNAK